MTSAVTEQPAPGGPVRERASFVVRSDFLRRVQSQVAGRPYANVSEAYRLALVDLVSDTPDGARLRERLTATRVDTDGTLRPRAGERSSMGTPVVVTEDVSADAAGDGVPSAVFQIATP